MRWFLFGAALLSCAAQQPPPIDLALLSNIKLRVAENLQHLPNYTCTETIEREMRWPYQKKLEMVDTVRLEVALVENKEMYGWPGSNRIAESELTKLVGGTIGNGDFGLLVESIFFGDGTHFASGGNVKLAGREAIRFDYRVPLYASGFRVSVPPNAAMLAHHGSVWLDPASFDLVRLELVADDIPEYLGISAIRKAIEYERMTIGGSDFLLPKASELMMAEPNGTENRNLTSFQNCRQYSGESVLSFADPPPDVPESKEAPARVVELPPEFSAELSLVTPIDSRTAAVGDRIQLKLDREIKTGRTAAAPKGAILTARVARLHHQQDLFLLEFELESLDFENAHADLRARENIITARRNIQEGEIRNRLGPSRGIDFTGAMLFEGSRLRLPRGFAFTVHSRLIQFRTQ